MSDEEKKAVESFKEENNNDLSRFDDFNSYTQFKVKRDKVIIDLIEKQSKEIEELKETLKCTQNSWYEDTQKIEEMKKQIDLDNECEIALNNRIMDLENVDKKWKDKIKAKIEVLEKLQKEFPNNDEIRIKIIAYKELLEKE